jgi:hypothetical protein
LNGFLPLSREYCHEKALPGNKNRCAPGKGRAISAGKKEKGPECVMQFKPLFHLAVCAVRSFQAGFMLPWI